MITVPKTLPPPTLYKYLPPERADIIRDLRVRFSPPSDFNDAFDTRSLSQRGSAWARAAQDSLRNGLGVLCLAERADVHLMWVNYARNHTGFVLGFRTDLPFFDQDGRTLGKVDYNPPPVLNDPDENGCFYKSPDWNYEDEWRCVRRFGKSESRLVEIDPTLVAEIIFGWLIEPGNIAKITSCAERLKMSPRFYFSSPSFDQQKFVNIHKIVVPCEYCDGHGFRSEDP